jgi:tetratricopeptide (TPR) repeat protein
VAKESTQDNFGVEMARQNLWREAMFRFKRAVQMNPGNAMAHSNLAVAYEANGDFESARKEYLEALKLDRTNSYIQKNYSRFVEFLSRNRKRSTAPKTAIAPSTIATPSGPTAVTDTSGLPPGRPTGAEPPKLPTPAPVPQPPQPPPPGGQ